MTRPPTTSHQVNPEENDTPLSYDLAPRPLSRLTYKIMSLNFITVIVLGMGIAYLGQFRENLISAEMEILSTETRLYAAILSDRISQNPAQRDPVEARKVLQSLLTEKQQRLRLFSEETKILAEANIDTSQSLPSSAEVFWLEKGFAKLIEWVSVDFKLPPYPAEMEGGLPYFQDVPDAFAGRASLSAWRSKSGGLILSSATPILQNGKVGGAIQVTRWGTGIEETFSKARLDILRFVLVSLIMTSALSLYLAGSIGHPLRKLASAAESLRLNRGQWVDIPDMSDRQDEIGELSHSLKEMTGFLRARLDTIERFAADVAHELKNPLTSMRSAVETLQRVKTEADREKLVGIILHDLQRMDRLISDISQATRLDVELARELPDETDLRQVLLPLIDAYRKPLERARGSEIASNSNIHVEGLQNSVTVLGHAGRLAQVFENLITNALSFSPPERPIRILVDKNKERVKVVVEDDGPGIPPNRLEKIFDRFYSERPVTESFGMHSGLGLSIARQIVTAHGGTIHAENCINESGVINGARFIVRLRIPQHD